MRRTEDKRVQTTRTRAPRAHANARVCLCQPRVPAQCARVNAPAAHTPTLTHAGAALWFFPITSENRVAQAVVPAATRGVSCAPPGVHAGPSARRGPEVRAQLTRLRAREGARWGFSRIASKPESRDHVVAWAIMAQSRGMSTRNVSG